MNEPQQLSTVLPLEKIAKFLGVTPRRIRVCLRRLAKGGYAIEIEPGKWVSVGSILVERVQKEPKPKRPGESLAEAVDKTRSVAELKQLLAKVFPASERIQ